MLLFGDRLLSHSDTGFRIYVKNWLDWYRGHVLKRFLRRAVALQRQIKNFGANVVYCFLLTHTFGICPAPHALPRPPDPPTKHQKTDFEHTPGN